MRTELSALRVEFRKLGLVVPTTFTPTQAARAIGLTSEQMERLISRRKVRTVRSRGRDMLTAKEVMRLLEEFS